MTGPEPVLFSRVVRQSDCGDESFRRLWRRPLVFGPAGFKPALTEITGRSNATAGGVKPRSRPSPRLRGLDEHDAFGCLRRGRCFDGLGAKEVVGEA